MRSANVTLRSNVMCGRLKDVETRDSVRHAVRGGAAIERVLKKLQVSASIRYLTPVQLAELAQQVRCGSCGGRPEGPVVEDGQVVLKVRCPRGTCVASAKRARELTLDQAALLQLGHRAAGNDLGSVVDGLLRGGQLERRRELAGPLRSMVVRLSPSTFYLVSGLSTLELSQCTAGLLDS
jgi:hypothetical protein